MRMMISATTAGTSAGTTLSVSKQRMISMILRSPTTRRCCYDSSTSQRTPSFFSGFPSLSPKSYRTLSTFSSVDAFSSQQIPLPPSEPQLALAYDYVDYDSDTEENEDTNSLIFNTIHHMNISDNQSTTNSIPVRSGRSGGGDGHNVVPTTNTVSSTSTSGSPQQYHGKSYSGGGSGGSGGSSRHRCPKCGTFVTFQHADFDVANSHSSNSTTFYCAHCSGWFLLQHTPPPPSTTMTTTASSMLSSNASTTSTSTSTGRRTVTVAGESTNPTAATTTTTTTSDSQSSPIPPQQKLFILRTNHSGGGGGSLPPPIDSSTQPPPLPEPNTIPTPYEIVQGLNEYVIGQRNVKIALSVGIYNHYKRLFINTHSMMNTNPISSSSPEESIRSSSSQRPSSSSSSFIIVRHPDRNSNMNDLNIDINDPNNMSYHQSSTSTSNADSNESNFADYTNHLAQFGTTTTTTKKATHSTTSRSTGSNNSDTSMNENDSNTNNIKFNGRDHSMGDTDDNIEIDKSNILLLGPTGSGKTLLVRTLAKLIQVPLVITDATCLTQAGYVGEDVESILFKLYIESNHDIHKTQRGIIYIDEVDKIRKSGGPNISISRDVSGEGVQHALLKIVEGNVINVPKEPGRKNPRGDFLQIDTTNILFIAGGAFSGLEHIINRRMDAASIGFNANMKKMNMDTNIKVQGRYFDQAIPKDLVEYGMIPEFVGRFPVITTTKGLDLDNLVDILTKPKNSIMKQYTKLFHMDDVQFHITDDALLEIAKTAYTRGTGARGLRSITDAVLMNTQYIVPSYHHNNKNIHTVYVDGAAVRKERPIILLHDPNLTVEMYESYLQEGRPYSSIPGVMPVSIDEFESSLQQQQAEVESNLVMATEPSSLEEVAA